MIDELLRGFPLLPVPETLQKKLDDLIDKVEKSESYQKDAGLGSSGKPAEKR